MCWWSLGILRFWGNRPGRWSGVWARGTNWIGNRRTILDLVAGSGCYVVGGTVADVCRAGRLLVFRGFGLSDSIGSVADVCRAGRLLVFCGFCVVVVDRWFGAGWCCLD